MRFFNRTDSVVSLAALALLAAVPLLTSDNYVLGVLITAICYAIWAGSWDLLSGLTGRENFGHSLFIGAGAYAAAYLNTAYGIDLGWGIVVAPLVSGTLGALIGLPTLRLQGPYFALATLVASAIAHTLCLLLWRVTGGEEGLSGILPMAGSQSDYYYLVLTIGFVSIAAMKLFALSDAGLVLRAIGSDEAICRAAAIDVDAYKITTFAFSAAFAGLGGALFAGYQLTAAPDLLSSGLSITIVVMAYVGGMGTIYGPAVAALFLALIVEYLRGFGEYRLLVYGLILLVVVRLTRHGFVDPFWRWLKGRLA